MQIEEFTFYSHAFSRVDWPRLYDALTREKEAKDLEAEWETAKVEWCEQLKNDLGGQAQVRRAANIVLMTDREESEADACVHFADQVHGSLRLAFTDLSHPHAFGRVPILLFDDDADYYEYLGYYYPEEGTFPASCGVQLSADGCPHIAAYYDIHGTTPVTVAHELCHLMVSHLPLPLWVNEGVAMKLPRALAVSSPRTIMSDPAWRWWTALGELQAPLFSDDILERHQNFWNEENIQDFWAGTSFDEPGESNTLSYSLAEILVTKMSEDWRSFLGFLATVQYADGGQTAALDHLGTCLGVSLEPILGAGRWRPVRKALVDSWGRRAAMHGNKGTTEGESEGEERRIPEARGPTRR